MALASVNAVLQGGDAQLGRALEDVSAYISTTLPSGEVNEKTAKYHDSKFFVDIARCVEIIGRHLGQLYPGLPPPQSTDDVQLTEAAANFKKALRVAEPVVGRQGIFKDIFDDAAKIMAEVDNLKSSGLSGEDNDPLRKAVEGLVQHLGQAETTMKGSKFFVELQRHSTIFQRYVSFKGQDTDAVRKYTGDRRNQIPGMFLTDCFRFTDTVQEAVIELQRIMEDAREIVGNSPVFIELEKKVNAILRNTQCIPADAGDQRNLYAHATRTTPCVPGERL